jgi:hypothetical protein
MAVAPGCERAEDEVTSALHAVRASIPTEADPMTGEFLVGMADALEWLLGWSKFSPVRGIEEPATAKAIAFDAGAAIDAPQGRDRHRAGGVMRVLSWARGITDGPLVTWQPQA